MIDLPSALADHLRGATTTVCQAWIVRLADGSVMGFTEHDRPLLVSGVTCEPETAFDPGVADLSEGLAGDVTSLSGALSSQQISSDDLLSGRYDGARIERWLVNWQDPGEAALMARFHAGEVSTSGPAFTLELRSFSAALDQVRMRSYLRQCDAEFADARCGINAADPRYSAAATVSATHGPGRFSIAPLAGFAPDWFDGGRIDWTSGAFAGRRSAVASISGGTVVRLAAQSPDEPAVGDTLVLIAGCDKRFATCRAKFANAINFRGFPHIPGNERALTYPDSEAIHDGGPLVP